MFGFSKLLLPGLTLAAFLVAGCTANKPPESTLAPSTQGVTCTKCQVTWVKVPASNQKGRIISYRWTKKDVCPDCMDAVQSFFNIGKLQHTCNTCGADTMQICETHN